MAFCGHIIGLAHLRDRLRTQTDGPTFQCNYACRQGKASFADSGVFVEKYVECARHIEVQIFGDGKGRIVTLPERECSIQRRHQKIIEETPSPFVGQFFIDPLLVSSMEEGCPMPQAGQQLPANLQLHLLRGSLGWKTHACEGYFWRPETCDDVL